MRRTAQLAFALALTITTGCPSAKPPAQPELPIDVEAVLEHPEYFSGRDIAIRGCYEFGFERSTLERCPGLRQPKEMSDFQEMIWVDARYAYEGMAREYAYAIPSELRETPKLSPDEERRRRVALNQLSKCGECGKCEVVLQGRFESLNPKSVWDSKDSREHGFGHLDSYDHQLVLRKVLSVAAKSTSPK